MGFFSSIKNIFIGKKSNDYISGFSKTNNVIGKKIKFVSKDYDSNTFCDKLMKTLIEADIGYKTSQKICDLFISKAKNQTLNNDDIIEIITESFKEIYLNNNEKNLIISDKKPIVDLIIGVNGSGKTTSIAKLANKYILEGKKVLLIAADTFRAGAIEQLNSWAKKLNCEIVLGKEGQDPSSVLVDGCKYALDNDIDIVLCDTAGRLQNKTNLMKELEKMNRVLTKQIEGAPHNTFIVIDANTGQNGISQAELFNEVTNINGIILTKMDGTSKGGIILSIKDLLNIPVRFICTGEKIDQIAEFDLDYYLYSILGDINNES